MKRLFLGLVLAATASLLIPMSASAAEYDTFVGCDDLSENPVPAHVCQVGDFPAAYFESDEETEYEICVEFPDAAFICAEEQLAKADLLYINSITSEEAGDHFVYWFVEGVEVGFWAFRLDPPPPPVKPTIPLPAIPIPPLAAPAPAPSAACLKSQKKVGKLKAQLRNAGGPKQKAKIKAKLKKARSAAKLAC